MASSAAISSSTVLSSSSSASTPSAPVPSSVSSGTAPVILASGVMVDQAMNRLYEPVRTEEEKATLRAERAAKAAREESVRLALDSGARDQERVTLTVGDFTAMMARRDEQLTRQLIGRMETFVEQVGNDIVRLVGEDVKQNRDEQHQESTQLMTALGELRAEVRKAGRPEPDPLESLASSSSQAMASSPSVDSQSSGTASLSLVASVPPSPAVAVSSTEAEEFERALNQCSVDSDSKQPAAAPVDARQQILEIVRGSYQSEPILLSLSDIKRIEAKGGPGHKAYTTFMGRIVSSVTFVVQERENRTLDVFTSRFYPQRSGRERSSALLRSLFGYYAGAHWLDSRLSSGRAPPLATKNIPESARPFLLANVELRLGLQDSGFVRVPQLEDDKSWTLGPADTVQPEPRPEWRPREPRREKRQRSEFDPYASRWNGRYRGPDL